MTPKRTATKAIKKSSKETLKHFRKSKKYTNLGNKLITTKANTKSEKIILSILKNEFPNHHFSTDAKEDLTKIKNEFIWVIDSLDGTGNFARGIPLFGISITLLKNKEPILGLINLPTLNLTITAEKNKGAFLNNKKIKVSDKTKDPFIYLPTAWKEYSKIFSLMKKICPNVAMTRQVDSTAFGLAQVALGEAEGLIHYESVPNDLLAGILLIKEAGGKVTDQEGKDWTIKSKNILATNKIIHNKILELIKWETQ